jgi:hypothetical protein
MMYSLLMNDTFQNGTWLYEVMPSQQQALQITKLLVKYEVINATTER